MSRRPPDTAAQFSRQAAAYATSPSHARGADLDIVIDFAAPEPGDLCLDVACGPGHTAFRLAARAGRVIAADIAPGMLATARRLAAERGLDTLSVLAADAAALPVADASLDLVTCRIAPHHFRDVPGFLRETARVLKPQGRFVLEDSLAPDDVELAAFLHALERRRDPTHVRSLTRAAWLREIAAAGLQVTRETVYRKRHDFDQWLRRSGLDEPEIAAIAQAVRAAPRALRAALFRLEGPRVVELRDRKLILRAERVPGPGSCAGRSASERY